jgi:hypothetical protein
MPRVKSNVKKVRKNYELPLKHVSMIEELRTMMEFGSEQEVLRYAISQCYYLEKALKDGNWLYIRDKDGKERAIIFK